MHRRQFMKVKANDEFERLISSLLDGGISESDHKRLSSLLENSPEKRRLYLEYIRMESLLHWESNEFEPVVTSEEKSHDIILFRWPLWIGSIAAVFIAMFAVWWTGKSAHFGNPLLTDSHSSSTLSSAKIEDVRPSNHSHLTNLGDNLLHKSKSLQSTDFISKQRALQAIEILHNNGKVMHGGIIEYAGSIKRVNRLHHLLTPAENGILPASGSSMIGFDKMSIRVENQSAQTSEMIQVLDIRDAFKGTFTGPAKIFAAVKFNQSYGNSQEGAEFGITLQAFKNEQSVAPKELSRADQKLTADRDPSTWNELSSELEIPKDTEFLVVSLSARKHGPDSLLANSSSYYADDLQLFLSFGEQSLIGPI